MQIRASCKIDYDSIKALTHLSLFRKSDPKKRMLTGAIIYLFLAGVLIRDMVIFSDLRDINLLLVVIAVLALECFLYFLYPRIQYNAAANLKNVENVYLFCDDVLKISSKGNLYNGESEIGYSFFVKAFETSRYFFLFQTKRQVFVIDKNTIEGGTAADIRNQLASRIKGKYIICRY